MVASKAFGVKVKGFGLRQVWCLTIGTAKHSQGSGRNGCRDCNPVVSSALLFKLNEPGPSCVRYSVKVRCGFVLAQSLEAGGSNFRALQDVVL